MGEKLAGCGYELVQEEYSWEAVAGRVEEAVKVPLPSASHGRFSRIKSSVN
ncbi:hypothetical protein NJ959_07410 [Symplocastrum sp. BBK-W-15]|uniref:Uncharacterized protein n=1 Tax=Limnofasciculus baicalensis BBK-W-15 TaxID=2699891 RepID=A0AAE3GTK2_9CYAN|nr:hypothetical protein [Limnofasciculus baicalensis BBK-W-15]